MFEEIRKETNLAKKNELFRQFIKSDNPDPYDVLDFIQEQLDSTDSAVWSGILKEIESSIQAHLDNGYTTLNHFNFSDESNQNSLDGEFDEFEDEKKVLEGQEKVTSVNDFVDLSQKEKLAWLTSCAKIKSRNKLLKAWFFDLLKNEGQPFVICKLLEIGPELLKGEQTLESFLSKYSSFINSKDESLVLAGLKGVSQFFSGDTKKDKPLIELFLKKLSDGSQSVREFAASSMGAFYKSNTSKYIARQIAKVDSDFECRKMRVFLKTFPELESTYEDKMREFGIQQAANKEPNLEPEEQGTLEEIAQDIQEELLRSNKPKAKHWLVFSIVLNLVLGLVVVLVWVVGQNSSRPEDVMLLNQKTTELSSLEIRFDEQSKENVSLKRQAELFSDAINAYLDALWDQRTVGYNQANKHLKNLIHKYPSSLFAKQAKQILKKSQENNMDFVWQNLKDDFKALGPEYEVSRCEAVLSRADLFLRKFRNFKHVDTLKSMILDVRLKLPKADQVSDLGKKFDLAISSKDIGAAKLIIAQLSKLVSSEKLDGYVERLSRTRLGDREGPVFSLLTKAMRLRELYGDDRNPYYHLRWYYLYEKMNWPDSAKEKLSMFWSKNYENMQIVRHSGLREYLSYLRKHNRVGDINTLKVNGQKSISDLEHSKPMEWFKAGVGFFQVLTLNLELKEARKTFDRFLGRVKNSNQAKILTRGVLDVIHHHSDKTYLLTKLLNLCKTHELVYEQSIIDSLSKKKLSPELLKQEFNSKSLNYFTEILAYNGNLPLVFDWLKRYKEYLKEKLNSWDAIRMNSSGNKQGEAEAEMDALERKLGVFDALTNKTLLRVCKLLGVKDVNSPLVDGFVPIKEEVPYKELILKEQALSLIYELNKDAAGLNQLLEALNTKYDSQEKASQKLVAEARILSALAKIGKLEHSKLMDFVGNFRQLEDTAYNLYEIKRNVLSDLMAVLASSGYLDFVRKLYEVFDEFKMSFQENFISENQVGDLLITSRAHCYREDFSKMNEYLKLAEEKIAKEPEGLMKMVNVYMELAQTIFAMHKAENSN